MKKFRLNLITRLIIAIAIGILIGSFMPLWLCRICVTAASLFGAFLKFIIPLMILSYVTVGIADLSQNAGKLLLLTILIAYGSTLICGFTSFLVAYKLFPSFISKNLVTEIQHTTNTVIAPFFQPIMTPILDTVSSLILAFVLGLSLSAIKKRGLGTVLYSSIKDLSTIVDQVLKFVIVPLLPSYICGTLVEITHSGKTFILMSILYKVFLVVISLQLIYLFIQFLFAGFISKKKPFILIKNQIPGYLAALGTQSSIATIPVNLECAKNNGVSEEIRDFIIPLCANIHMCGSIITIICCATAVCLIYGIPIESKNIVLFIMILGVAMVSSPGAPGGSIMTALPFLYIIFGKELGNPNGQLCSLMIALYITQDSFGTACNVSGDNAIGVIVDTFYKKLSNKK